MHTMTKTNHIMWYARTPVDRYCVLSRVSAHVTVSPRWYLGGVILRSIVIMRHDTAGGVVYNVTRL